MRKAVMKHVCMFWVLVFHLRSFLCPPPPPLNCVFEKADFTCSNKPCAFKGHSFYFFCFALPFSSFFSLFFFLLPTINNNNPPTLDTQLTPLCCLLQAWTTRSVIDWSNPPSMPSTTTRTAPSTPGTSSPSTPTLFPPQSQDTPH